MLAPRPHRRIAHLDLVLVNTIQGPPELEGLGREVSNLPSDGISTESQQEDQWLPQGHKDGTQPLSLLKDSNEASPQLPNGVLTVAISSRSSE